MDTSLKKFIKWFQVNIPMLYPGILYILYNSEKIELENNEDDFIAAINHRGQLKYSDKLLKLSDREIIFVLIHELLHFYMEHFTRMKYKHKDPKLWNIATDLAINSIITNDLGYKLNFGVYPENFNFPELLSAEEYYALLSNRIIKIPMNLQKSFDKHEYEDNNSDQNCNNCNSNQDNNNNTNSIVCKLNNGQQNQENGEDNNNDNSIGSNIKEQIKDLIKQGENLASNKKNHDKSIGKGISNILRNITVNIDKPKVDWKRVLKEYLNIIFDNKTRSFMRPNRKINTAVIPSLIDREPEYELTPYIVIDLSGSINDSELNMFLSEIINIFTMFKIENFRLITFADGIIDNKIIKIDKHIKNNKKLLSKTLISNMSLDKSGGTSIDEVINFIENDKSKHNLSIIFTDGMFDYNFNNKLKKNYIILYTYENPAENVKCKNIKTVYADI